MGNMALIGLQAGAQAFQGIAAKQGGDADAAALREDARLTELQGNLDALEAGHESRARIGEMIAAMGGDPTSGSNADIIMQSQVERQFELLNLRYNAGSKARDLRYKASQAKAAGRNAMIGGFINAGASALGAYQGTQDRAAILKAIGRERSAQLPGRIPVPGTGAGSLAPFADGDASWFSPVNRQPLGAGRYGY